MNPEQEIAFEKELSRPRELRKNAEKSIKKHRDEVAFHKARLATEERSLILSQYAEARLVREIHQLWKKHDDGIFQDEKDEWERIS